MTSQRGGYYLYDKETFDKNGYMEKEVKLTSLQTEGVNPSLEEITMFSGSNISDGREIAALVEANVYTVNDFQVGENVEVVSGELTGLKGIVNGVDNDLVTVKTDSNGLVVFLVNLAFSSIPCPATSKMVLGRWSCKSCQWCTQGRNWNDIKYS